MQTVQMRKSSALKVCSDARKAHSNQLLLGTMVLLVTLMFVIMMLKNPNYYLSLFILASRLL